MEFSKQQMKFFDKAASVAATSEFERFRLGCVAVLKNKIISMSPNKLKTHRIQAEFDKFRQFNCRSDPKNMHSLHAEIACISMIKQEIPYKDLELYIVRLLKDDSFGLARPCPACFQYILSKGIHRVFYTTNMGFSYEEI